MIKINKADIRVMNLDFNNNLSIGSEELDVSLNIRRASVILDKQKIKIFASPNIQIDYLNYDPFENSWGRPLNPEYELQKVMKKDFLEIKNWIKESRRIK